MLDLIAAQIASEGPMLFGDFVDMALYDARGGFYANGGRAGRRGDFVTSPEVGPLFGACIANAIDAVWETLDRPERFGFVDVGAGPGTLARSILHAEPACSAALEYVAVEVSTAQRELHPAGVRSVTEMQPIGGAGIVFANELLDNLPFDIVEQSASGWRQRRVAMESDLLCFVTAELVHDRYAAALPDAPVGSRAPLQRAAMAWLDQACRVFDRGQVIVIDYGGSTTELVQRGDWLRTYRAHERGADPLVDPGHYDITVDVAFDQLALVATPTSLRQQADVLQTVGGIGKLVEEGKVVWAERAHIGDLTAVRARSRIGEAEALLDPGGLGAFVVAEWQVPIVAEDGVSF